MKCPTFCALVAALTMPTAASALPRTMEAFEMQEAICKEGLDMIIAGASDDDEIAMYIRKLEENGWEEEGDLEDLVLLCSFYKQGWIEARSGG